MTVNLYVITGNAGSDFDNDFAVLEIRCHALSPKSHKIPPPDVFVVGVDDINAFIRQTPINLIIAADQKALAEGVFSSQNHQ